MTRLCIIALCGMIFLAACSVSTSSQVVYQSRPDSDGVALYEEYCAGCHRTLAQTTKAQRSAARLRSAIKVFPSMKRLNFLSDVQLEAVSSALETVNMQQVSR